MDITATKMNITPATYHKRLIDGQLMMSTIIYGNPNAIRLAIACMLIGRAFMTTCDPGLGKTALALALQKFLRGARAHVLECTAQMKPSDVIGQVIRDPDTGERKTDLGKALQVEILLADELSRATEDTQAVFLPLIDNHGAMVGDKFYPLPPTNFVCATRNYETDPGSRRLIGPLLSRMAAECEMLRPSKEEMKLLGRNTDVHRNIFNVEGCLDLEEVLLIRNYITNMVKTMPDPVQSYLCDLIIATDTRSPEVFQTIDFKLPELKGKALRKLRFGQKRLTADQLKELPVTNIRQLDVMARGVSMRSYIWQLHLACALAFMDGRDQADFGDIEQAWCAQTHQLLMRPVARSYGIEPMHILTAVLDSVDY